jgi:hypothetical protein
MDKAREADVVREIATDRAARVAPLDAAADVEWAGADRVQAFLPTREIPGFKPNSMTCKPPSKN